jgi:transposase InsO family protein
MSNHDPVFRLRVRAMALAQELGSVQTACRMLGINRSTYYRWRADWVRFGDDILQPRERRPPRMPNQISLQVEQQLLGFALSHPGFGPARIASELKRPLWGGIKISANGAWRVLRRHGLNTRAKRRGLAAGYAAPPELPPRPPRPERHLKVDHPGELVQIDCFYVGRLSGTKGIVWQYTATDVVSAYTWAELHSTPRNPSARWTSELAQRVAAELGARNFKLESVMTDNASEFRSQHFENTLRQLEAKHIFIAAGRPQTNGCVERVQGTILEECWKPSFAHSLIPKSTALAQDLDYYLRYYNQDRAHNGRWTKGRTPEEVLTTWPH